MILSRRSVQSNIAPAATASDPGRRMRRSLVGGSQPMRGRAHEANGRGLGRGLGRQNTCCEC